MLFGTSRIETCAEQNRLRVSRDECNDQEIQGRRGQLYFDGPELCLMVLGGEPAIRSKWKEPAGKLWMGDISPHPETGRRVQDVRITGIPLDNGGLQSAWPAARRNGSCRKLSGQFNGRHWPRRIVLWKPPGRGQRQTVESSAEAEVRV